MNKCVYLLYDNDNVVRYVGQGTPKRIYDLQNGRSEEFKEIAKRGRFEIISSGLSREEALEKEKQLLEDYFSGKYPCWDLINKNKGTSLKYIKYDDIKDKLKIDISSPTFLVWNYDCVKTNGRLCSKARIGFKAGMLNKNGYGTLIINRTAYPIHRIVWALYNKSDLDPSKVVNHIDGNPSNNHPENLEAISQKENVHKSTKKNPPKSTGIVGVRIADGAVKTYYSDSNCKQRTKSFSINKYGEELAISLAVAWRKQRMIEEYGEDFTYNHLNGDLPSAVMKYSELDENGEKLLADNYFVNDRYRPLVINRRRLINVRSEFIPIFGTDSVANPLNSWLEDGFIGIVIHGCLIEEYDENIHRFANNTNPVIPVEALKVHIRRAFVGGGKTYLSPSDFSIRVKGYHDINTATLIGTQTRRGGSVYGVHYKEGTITDLNAEILRRLFEQDKEIAIE